MKNDSRFREDIAHLLESTKTLVVQSAEMLSEAHECMQRNELNLAIGTALCVEKDLEIALILYRAALALHRLQSKEATCK